MNGSGVLQLQVGGGPAFAICHNDGTLHSVLEFADVAGLRVLIHSPDGVFAEGNSFLSVRRRTAAKELPDE